MTHNIVCISADGKISCGMTTKNENMAMDYIKRKTLQGFITIDRKR
jgi:hypothetical protein